MIDNKFEIGKKVYFMINSDDDHYPILEQGRISEIKISKEKKGILYELDNGYYEFGEKSLYGSFEEAIIDYIERLKIRLEVNEKIK